MYVVDNRLRRDEWMTIETDRLRLAVLRKSAVDKVTDYFVRNRDFHRVWSQTQSDDYFTRKIQKAYLKSDEVSFFNDRLIPLYIFEKGNPDKVIGRISLFNIARGGMQSATVGYHLDEKYTGNGYMREALTEVLNFAFNDLKLHRIEAYIMPHNERSLNLIRKVGFTEEGLKKSYMHINGEWRDHISFSYLNEN